MFHKDNKLNAPPGLTSNNKLEIYLFPYLNLYIQCPLVYAHCANIRYWIFKNQNFIMSFISEENCYHCGSSYLYISVVFQTTEKVQITYQGMLLIGYGCIAVFMYRWCNYKYIH